MNILANWVCLNGRCSGAIVEVQRFSLIKLAKRRRVNVHVVDSTQVARQESCPDLHSVHNRNLIIIIRGGFLCHGESFRLKSFTVKRPVCRTDLLVRSTGSNQIASSIRTSLFSRHHRVSISIISHLVGNFNQSETGSLTLFGLLVLKSG